MNQTSALSPGVLSGIRVLDISHQYSGANAGSIFSDFGAEVVAIEHPQGSPIRTMLPKKDGHSLWWKVIQRGKDCVTLNLSSPKGSEMFLKLAKQFDVIIENFRPGTLERWGIGPEDLERVGANVALLRISGYGQTGPKKHMPGFGTVAEATSGFAHLNGFPDGPPAFPSTTLGDGVASLFGVIGVLASLVNRKGGPRGVEVIDVALFEALFRIIPTQVAAYDQLSVAPKRPGNFLGSHGVLRNAYKSADDRWVCVSAVGAQAMRRIMAAAQADDLIEQLDDGIMTHPDSDKVQAFLTACNVHLEAWTMSRPYTELMRSLQEADAVHSAIYSMKEISEDEQYKARDDLVQVPDGELGDITMQGVVPKFPSRTHVVKHAGRSRGHDNASIYGKLLGIGPEDLEQLKKDGVV